MRKKFLLITLVVLLFVLNVSLQKVWAKNDNSNISDPPEAEGTYDVPGHTFMITSSFV